jgi:ABC-type Mn2+/Zn2+ transport system permease subunit
MRTGQIIIGSIISLIDVLLGVYVSFTARKKGPILSNTYIWLSKEERARADKKAEYMLVTVVFSCLTAVFAFLALYIFTLWKWPLLLMWLFIAAVVIYAIAQAAKTK